MNLITLSAAAALAVTTVKASCPFSDWKPASPEDGKEPDEGV
jgi:hypothetical protein